MVIVVSMEDVPSEDPEKFVLTLDPDSLAEVNAWELDEPEFEDENKTCAELMTVEELPCVVAEENPWEKNFQIVRLQRKTQ